MRREYWKKESIEKEADSNKIQAIFWLFIGLFFFWLANYTLDFVYNLIGIFLIVMALIDYIDYRYYCSKYNQIRLTETLLEKIKPKKKRYGKPPRDWREV